MSSKTMSTEMVGFPKIWILSELINNLKPPRHDCKNAKYGISAQDSAAINKKLRGTVRDHYDDIRLRGDTL